MPGAIRHDSHQAFTAARDPNFFKKRHQQCGVKKHSTTQLRDILWARQLSSSLIGVQPEKKLVLLLSILFFLFTSGIWFSWASSSLTSREAAVLDFFTNICWSVISFRTYWKSKKDNSGVGHCPEEASQLALELGGSTYRNCQGNIKSCLISLLKSKLQG